MIPAAVRVVFMGSPGFAVPSLDALVDAGYDVVGVVTQPDRPAGRGAAIQRPEVKVAALRHGIDVFQPTSLRDEGTVERLVAFVPDLFVVAAYGKILPRPVLAIPGRGAVNVHASLLPRWRGASPIASAILAGDDETGVSIMEMALKMDAGPVISSVALTVLPNDTTGSLETRLARLGAEALMAALPRWLDGSLPAVPQDEAEATDCRTIAKEDGHLRLAMTATEAERAVRAYNPWPGAYVHYKGQRLAIWAASVVSSGAQAPPGSMRVEGRRSLIAFAHGTWLELNEIQKPGGKRIAGEQFLNGERGKLESMVGLA